MEAKKLLAKWEACTCIQSKITAELSGVRTHALLILQVFISTVQL